MPGSDFSYVDGIDPADVARMIIAYLPLLVFIIGVLVYALSANAKVAEIGRTMMWTGLLVTLAVAAGHVVRIGT